MKKLLLSILVCFILALPAHAQGPIHLPLITKGSSCMGFQWAVLQISDGTTTVDLLKGEQVGFHLQEWTPQVAQLKGGGQYQESNLAPGRRPIFGVYENVNEPLNLIVNGFDQDGIIAEAQNLVALLNKARARFFTDWQNTDVYLKARAQCESNARYAELLNYSLPQLGNPYAQPFFTASQIAAMENLTLGLERGHWLAEPPGSGESVAAQSKQLWDYTVGWQVFSSFGAVPDLPVPSAQYLVQAVGSAGIVVAPNDAADDVYYSTDQGDTWAASGGTGSVAFRDILLLSNGHILMSEITNARIIRSTDNGANFSVLTSAVGGTHMAILKNNNLIISDNGDDIYVSSDNGANWSNVGTIGTSGTCRQFAISPTTGTVIAHVSQGSPTYSRLYRSADNGATWTLVLNPPRIDTTAKPLAADQSGNFYFITVGGDVWKSTDDGATWSLVNASLLSPGFLLFVDSNNDLFAVVDTGGGGNVIISRSTDGGSSFDQEFSSTGEFEPRNLSESSDGDFYLGGAGLIFKLDDEEEFGTSTDDKLYVTNHQKVAQLSHIFTDDGGSFSPNLFPISAAFDLYPASPAVNDALYFGIQSGLDDSGPFGGIRLYITIPTTITTSYAITFEYWNGAWSTLTVQDNTNVGSGAFSQIGYNSIHWQQPSDWATTSVNSVTGYWIRARISAITGTLTPPTHGNADIIAFNTGFVEVLANAVSGELPALLRLKVRNESGNGGPGGSEPLLYDNRVIIGLRSYSRGANFQAYLNAADEQNPFGVTVTAGTNTSFAADSTTPTGRRAVYNPGGVEAMATRLTFTLNSNIAADFYGRFHLYLRGRRTAGSATDSTVRLQVETGSGGVIFTSVSKQFQTTTAGEVLDFDEVKIPLGAIKQSEVGDTMAIRVQASAASGTPDLYIYDIILMPVDEWAIDSQDGANESDSHIGLSGGIPRFLDVDSLTDFRNPIRSLVKQANANERVVSIYNPIANGEAILQAGARQKLWFLAMKTSATGTSYNWISEPEVTHSVQLVANQRYLTMRGSN